MKLDVKTLQQVAQLIDEGNNHFADLRLVQAVNCYRQVISIAPTISEAHNNLGSALREQGLISEAISCFEHAIKLRQNYASAHSNLLFTQHYAAGQTLADLLASHKAWAKAQLTGISAQSIPLRSFTPNQPLIIGLLSPDLYYHPVGVFLLPWLIHHNRQRYKLIAYLDNPNEDGMTRQITSQVTNWRHVDGMDDAALIQQISSDRVDILIDLAGHTAGNRLKVFAHRAAPVQVSWLGYSSTTAVPAMDYILMDGYLAPAGYEDFCTEKLIRLDGLRFCYTPPLYAPAVSPSPALSKGYVTFGSFNNLAKLTPDVLQTWAEILRCVPDSRLVLKWKSLADPETQERLRTVFTQHGIASDRLECRGWSNHPVMLAQYGDIDIALDPFPFSGGLTSCDALYMGVPIITMAGELPIGRQTASLLNVMGLDELIANNRVDYLKKAVALALNLSRIDAFRQNLRNQMLASRLCDGAAYARSIEKALSDMVKLQLNDQNNGASPMKTFLHVGCGPKRKDQTTRGFNTAEWNEQRLDIDEGVNPDIVGTMTDMSAVPDASVDAIFSSHNIEHLYAHEVPLALAEFNRVLKSDGFVVITCPDLQSVCALVAQDKLTEAAYSSPAGPIAPIDILYGHRPPMARGNLYMAHRCGFTQKVLTGTLQAAGFVAVAAKRREHPYYDLWAVASKEPMEEAELRALALAHFPA